MRRALVLGLVLVAACSSGGHASSNAAADLSRAVAHTLSFGSAHITVVMSDGLQQDSIENFAAHDAEGTTTTPKFAVQGRLVNGVEYFKVPKNARAAFG